MTDSFYNPVVDLNGKGVMITGGTGSFGRKFVETVLARYQPRRLIIFSRDEAKQYDMEQTYNSRDYPCLRYFIGDVRDRERLEMAMREIDIVIHAAALKHVPTAEYNPFECIQTNVHGAENVVRAALRSGVGKVLALSTDKAANPINLYGASKLAADKIFVAANALAGESETRFAVVRYGNVIGSRGSVVPLFLRLREEGAKVLPITDARMTRFWITLQRGVDFVLSSLKLMSGGEIFVPKIPSMRVTELARAVAPNIPQEIVGIRPGEKLHEMMITEDDARTTVVLNDRFVIEPAFSFWTRRGYAELDPEPVAEDFRYSSDTNDEWLEAEALQEMVSHYRS